MLANIFFDRGHVELDFNIYVMEISHPALSLWRIFWKLLQGTITNGLKSRSNPLIFLPYSYNSALVIALGSWKCPKCPRSKKISVGGGMSSSKDDNTRLTYAFVITARRENGRNLINIFSRFECLLQKPFPKITYKSEWSGRFKRGECSNLVEHVCY